MAIGRVARRDRAKTRRKRTYVIPVAAVVILAIAAIGTGVALGIFRAAPDGVQKTPVAVPDATATPAESMAASAAASTDTSATGALIEVPDVSGKMLADADTLLGIAGFNIVHVATPAGEAATGTVLAQEPAAGEVVERGTTITLTYADDGASVDPSSNMSEGRSPGSAYVVCIDPGHQDKANSDTEPIGPGSKTMKAKVTGGATGAVTKQREADFALAVSLKLKALLEKQGVKVVMTRTTGAVDISNAQRADVANKAGADLFIRVHADGNTNGDIRGLSTLYPAGNDWVTPISAKSLLAAKAVHSELLLETGAIDRGIVSRKDISGFNWSKVPSIIVECGFLSNPTEDKLLASDAYRNKLASGMSKGIMNYLKGE